MVHPKDSPREFVEPLEKNSLVESYGQTFGKNNGFNSKFTFS